MFVRIKLYELLNSLASAIDMVSPRLANHHQQVAYMALRIAEQINLPVERQREVFFASLIHDIGALSVQEKLELIESEPLYVNSHGFKGAKIIGDFKPLEFAAEIIKYHHIKWENGRGKSFNGEPVPFESHIVHLADRVCARISKDKFILDQTNNIYDIIAKGTGEMFAPQLLEVFGDISGKEYIWLDVTQDNPLPKIRNISIFGETLLSIDDLVGTAKIFSRIIDFRSRFTSVHSAGVANVAQQLARLAGMNENQCKMMLAAGYLHDLGKLAIDNDILEKNGKLSEAEFNKIRSHTYYTYHLLDKIQNFEEIKQWAAYHHERLNGKGYPFHIKGDDLSLGARIMAVADVFTAIKEDRPYRKSIEDGEAVRILKNMASQNALDEYSVNLLIENFEFFKEVLSGAENGARQQYQEYLKA